MATTSPSLSVDPHDYHTSIASTSKSSSASAVNQSNEASTVEEALCCFVCDIKIQGRHYALATCKTQSSRSRIIEKLGELVGDRYMIVICEDDIICRSCANLINTLDRLETQMHTIRNAILRFVEKKYSLAEGELVESSTRIKLGQPPRITKKRDSTSLSGGPDEITNKKSHTWIQCDKCRYTTQHNSFMIHHIRHHTKQKVFCDKCGIQLPSSCKQLNHKCNTDKVISNIEVETGKKEELALQYSQEATQTAIEKIPEEHTTEMSVQVPSEIHISSKTNNITLIDFPNAENLNIQSVLAPDATCSDNNKLVHVKVLPQIDMEEGLSPSTLLTNNSPGSEMIVKSRKFLGKQLLTLTEDGNSEMIEATSWINEPDPNRSNLDPSISF